MALTYTPPGELGGKLPNFSTPAVSGSTITSKDFSSDKGLLVMFICNHCPYVVAVEDRIIELVKEFNGTGISSIGVCSNDANDYPEDGFQGLLQRWQEKNYPFEYLHDESQKMAKDFGAVCTPDIFLYKNDGDGFDLYYRGRIDDSWKDESKVKTKELKTAMQYLLDGKPAPETQYPSMGCSIKWI